MSSIDLVTITLNGMPDEYQMFITGLTARENALAFNELAGILLQEEEHRRNLSGKNSRANLAL